MIIKERKNFSKGLITTIEEESLQPGSASRVLNWLFEGDRISLRRGMALVGDENSGTGKITGIYTARKADGEEVTFRKNGQKLEYYISTTGLWTEIGTNIFTAAGADDEAAFAEYNTNHGNQVWVSSPNSSLFKIMTANPGSYTDMYDSTKNFKGYIDILLNRMFLWGRVADGNGVYGSYIDNLNATTVTAEAIAGSGATRSGTLAFKAAGAKRTCYGVTFTDGTETFSDNFDGTLTGSAGGTGMINYTTGAYSITFAAPATTVTSTYQWEDSTNNGIADFTKSATRTAGQGFIFRQDNGGKIQNVKTYNDIQYCLHEFNTWKLNIGSDDTLATNRIFRDNSGIPNWRAAVSTGSGIYYIDDSNIGNPQFRLLTLDASSSEVIPISKSLNIDLSAYLFDKATAEEFGDYILFECRASDSTENNRTIVYDKLWNLWTVLDYCFTCKTTNNGELWVGDSLTANVYKLLSGTDDDDSIIDNYFESNLDNLEIKNLKKVKRLRLRGEIQKNQSYKIYLNFDKSDFVEVGEIRGDGSYVDLGNPITVGNNTVGTKTVGSGDVLEAYSYYKEISIRADQFQEVKIKFVAQAIGYVSISEYTYKDVRVKSLRPPHKYRN